MTAVAESVPLSPDEKKKEKIMDGAALIAAERQRQTEVEGWTNDHDDEHPWEMALAASGYARNAAHTAWANNMPDQPPNEWPWADLFWKPTPDDPVRQLVKAGALLAAEIDRLQRRG